MWFDSPAVRALIDLAFAEDAATGDAATEATVAIDSRGSATVYARSDAIFCGGPLFAAVMLRRDPNLTVHLLASEGERVQSGDRVIEIEGSLRSLLTAERPALNFLGRLAGIATQTNRCVSVIATHRTVIVDTRKTLPGFRALDKYAVRTGGGRNHRTALDAGVLIKENHIAAAGSVTRAVELARERAPHLLKIEIEIERLDQLDDAVAAGADIVMLDNMSLQDMRSAVKKYGDRIAFEASGNMTLERLAKVAATGVDLISMGALTHSVMCADFSLRIDGA